SDVCSSDLTRSSEHRYVLRLCAVVYQPSVEVSALNGDHRGYAVLVNHSAQPQNVTVFTNSGARSISRIAPEGPKPVQTEGSRWKMELGPYEGAIVEWK